MPRAIPGNQRQDPERISVAGGQVRTGVPWGRGAECTKQSQEGRDQGTDQVLGVGEEGY